MSIDVLLQALYDLPVSQAIREGSNLFPMIESTHVLAIVTVLGAISILDLRLIGVAAHTQSITRLILQLLPITWGAFIIAAICGGLLFISNATIYVHNVNFQAKMALMAAAGLNMAVFHLVTQKSLTHWDMTARPPVAARIAGFLSLAFWCSVVFFGRRVGFTLH